MTIGPLWGPSPNRPQCGRYLIAGLLRRVCTGRFGSQRDGANQEVMSKIVSKGRRKNNFQFYEGLMV
jgi:hypothetical protein